MKHVFRTLVVGAALAASGSAHALVEENEVLVGILNESNQQSMLIDTNLIAQDFADAVPGFTGAIQSYTSDAALSSTIQGFLAGSSAQFWVVGAWKDGFFDSFALTLSEITPLNTLDFAGNRMPNLVNQANFSTELGTGATFDAGILPGEDGHFDTPALGALSFDAVDSADFWFSQDTLFVDSSEKIGTWTLDNFTGEISYVPLPAAVWLFGAAVAGLALARRRSGAQA